MKERSSSASQSLKLLAAATTLIVIFLNSMILLPMSPVFAESEPQSPTCEACQYMNGETIEVSVTGNLLWYYSRLEEDGVTRTMGLAHLIYTMKDSVRDVYVLGYLSQHDTYRVSITSSLSPEGSVAYGFGFTHFDYMPVDSEKAVALNDVIKLEAAFTLSDGYRAFAHKLNQIATENSASRNETLKETAKVYRSMANEAVIMANEVRETLSIYDKPVISTLALITDLNPGTIEFWLCTIIANMICGYFAGMACDYVASIVGPSICSLLCGGPWNFWCMIGCVPGMIGFVYLICKVIAGYGCGYAADFICLHV